jgi:hypothetical protein
MHLLCLHLLSYKDFKSKNIAYNLLEGELSILKKLGNFLGRFGETSVSSFKDKFIFVLMLPSQNTKKHVHFQQNFLRKTETSPDTCFILKVIQNKASKSSKKLLKDS